MPDARRSGWRALVVERFALPALLVVATAQGASAQYVVGARLDLAGLAVVVLATTALLALLRLMDEIKDLEKDRIAHPERPLARGALSVDQARRGVALGSALLLVAAGAIALGRNALAGGLFGACVIYSLLMYREFFASAFLEARPLLYAGSHQVIVIPIYAFATAAAVPEAALSPTVMWFALSGLGASFTLEVCRKLDPDANPVLHTYLQEYGRARTASLVGGALLVVAIATRRIDLHAVVWPAAALVLATLPVLYARPEAHRWVAGTAALLAIVQPLSPTLRHLWGILR